jgi:hypothetical protein
MTGTGRQVAFGRRCVTAVGAMLAIGGPAFGGLIPGGGSPASDCYIELDVQGIENGTDAVKKGRKVTCVDGDPCDTGPVRRRRLRSEGGALSQHRRPERPRVHAAAGIGVRCCCAARSRRR